MTGFKATTTTVDLSIPTKTATVPVKSVFAWIIFHQNVGDGFNWRLRWTDYRNGFGDISSNFWLGLQRLYLLTRVQRYRLRIEMKQASDGLWFSTEYWSFEVGDGPNDRYRLDLSGRSGDATNDLRNDRNH